MPSFFTCSQARDLASEVDLQFKRYERIETRKAVLREGVVKNIEKVTAYEVRKTLAETPVDIINSDNRRFRIVALRRAGIDSLSDLLSLSPVALGGIEGISESGAYDILRIAKSYQETLTGRTKIRLSIDERGHEYSELILSIAKFWMIQQESNSLSDFISNELPELNRNLRSLIPACSRIKWLFSNSLVKERAEAAFSFLDSWQYGEKGLYVQKTLRKIDELSSLTVSEAWELFTENSISFINVIEDAVPGVCSNSCDEYYGLPEQIAVDVAKEPLHVEGLRVELRRYQVWGVKYILKQGHVLLGDEMGLGKTVQALAAMVSLANDGCDHFLVVAPLSVLTNWCREVMQKSTLRPVPIHGDNRTAGYSSWVERGGVGITTYETLPFILECESAAVDLLVVDEAHYVKNPEARRTRNVKVLINRSERVLFMTGTALENRAEEMVLLIKMLQPGVARLASKLLTAAAAPQFREAVSPAYYRRKRQDVLFELPDLIESVEWCEMGLDERNAYETSLYRSFMSARRLSWNSEDPLNCSKAIRLRELVEEARGEGRKVLVFSYFRETLNAVVEMLGPSCVGQINGSVSSSRRAELIDEFSGSDAGSVLVSQIIAGGTGVNIQEASVVVLCEPQLKPSIEKQAISRSYRMGQTRSVLVYRLLCSDSLDERIMHLLEKKQMIFDTFADESYASQLDMAEISAEEQSAMLREEIAQVESRRNTSTFSSDNTEDRMLQSDGV